MKRSHVLWFLGVTALAWVGCTTVKKFAVLPDVDPRDSGTPLSARIVGYTTTDAVYVPYEGSYRFNSSDSISFYRTPNTSMRDVVKPEFTLVRTQVASLSVKKSKPGATVLLVAATVVVFVALIAATSGDSSPPPPPTTTGPTSCPWSIPGMASSSSSTPNPTAGPPCRRWNGPT